MPDHFLIEFSFLAEKQNKYHSVIFRDKKNPDELLIHRDKLYLENAKRDLPG